MKAIHKLLKALDTIKTVLDEYKSQMETYKLKKLLNLQTKLLKHHIYWRLENK